uniref:Allergen Cul o 14 n=1 Tax=Culicoides obsoletus TaxID=289301 RepID=A0A7U3RE89_CULOB|nr:allergen Cul o 14 [Culicoides obsoletus]
MLTIVSITVFLFVTFASASKNRIVGGMDAIPHEFPYLISLQYMDVNESHHFCGGTIIKDNYVLTAAHCIRKDDAFISKVQVVAGAHDFLNKNGHEQTRTIASRVMHENYKGGVGPYDIGIIKLSSPFKLNKKVKVATLPPANFNATGLARISGWGYISEDYSDIRPKVLQKGMMKILNDTRCRELWGKESMYHDTNICANQIKGLTAVCKGDSGGPLSQKLAGFVEYVIGVTSWAHYPCNKKINRQFSWKRLYLSIGLINIRNKAFKYSHCVKIS